MENWILFWICEFTELLLYSGGDVQYMEIQMLRLKTGWGGRNRFENRV